jgi:hypothetical protein
LPSKREQKLTQQKMSSFDPNLIDVFCQHAPVCNCRVCENVVSSLKAISNEALLHSPLDNCTKQMMQSRAGIEASFGSVASGTRPDFLSASVSGFSPCEHCEDLLPCLSRNPIVISTGPVDVACVVVIASLADARGVKQRMRGLDRGYTQITYQLRLCYSLAKTIISSK